MAGTRQYAAAYRAAKAAGVRAGNGATPTPMVVFDADPLTGAPKPNARLYHVADGPCGFAWVHFKGTSGFARWAKKEGIARNAYGGGMDIWIAEHNQSYARKIAHANAMARVLSDMLGIDAYASGRLD